jgi:hypothetical protein
VIPSLRGRGALLASLPALGSESGDFRHQAALRQRPESWFAYLLFSCGGDPNSSSKFNKNKDLKCESPSGEAGV